MLECEEFTIVGWSYCRGCIVRQMMETEKAAETSPRGVVAGASASKARARNPSLDFHVLIDPPSTMHLSPNKIPLPRISRSENLHRVVVYNQH